jgi:hypothetical protein
MRMAVSDAFVLWPQQSFEINSFVPRGPRDVSGQSKPVRGRGG